MTLPRQLNFLPTSQAEYRKHLTDMEAHYRGDLQRALDRAAVAEDALEEARELLQECAEAIRGDWHHHMLVAKIAEALEGD